MTHFCPNNFSGYATRIVKVCNWQTLAATDVSLRGWWGPEPELKVKCLLKSFLASWMLLLLLETGTIPWVFVGEVIFRVTFCYSNTYACVVFGSVGFHASREPWVQKVMCVNTLTWQRRAFQILYVVSNLLKARGETSRDGQRTISNRSVYHRLALLAQPCWDDSIVETIGHFINPMLTGDIVPLSIDLLVNGTITKVSTRWRRLSSRSTSWQHSQHRHQWLEKVGKDNEAG